MYFIDLSLVEYSMAHYRPSELAAAALCLSLYLLTKKSLQEIWISTKIYYSNYTLEHIDPIMRKIAKIVVNVQNSICKAVYTKYLDPKVNVCARLISFIEMVSRLGLIAATICLMPLVEKVLPPEKTNPLHRHSTARYTSPRTLSWTPLPIVRPPSPLPFPDLPYEPAQRGRDILCKLMNRLQPGIITEVNISGGGGLYVLGRH